MLNKLLLLCLLLAGCSKSPTQASSSRPLLLVSIGPYRLLTERIAGEGFEVRTIVPAASNPHSYEPTSRQVSDMAEGTLWFQIGEPFEAKIFPVLKRQNPKLAVQDLREGIQMIEEEGSLGCKHCCMDHLDRHIWLSPKLAAVQVALIEKALVGQFPEHKELFEKNSAKLQEELLALDQEIKALLKDVKRRAILVSHPAFGYFCKEYELTQLSIEYEGKDPRPKHLEEILNKAVAESMEIALALPQYNNKGAQLIAEKLHVPIHLIDPYAENPFETLKKLAQLISDAH